MKKVEGYNHLYRNETGAIVNTDDSGYRAYKARRNASKRKDLEIRSLTEDLDSAKKEIEELKELVRQVLNK